MPDSNLIPRQTIVPCPPNVWTMVLPGDWSREYWGVGLPPTPPTLYMGMVPTQDLTSAAVLTPANTVLICAEMFAERQRTLVVQEWWIYNAGGFAAANVTIWTVTRLVPKPKAKSGLLMPNGNGRSVDDLSGYDPAKMDAMLNEMKRQTRRIANARVRYVR